jgi:hypothetical protein
VEDYVMKVSDIKEIAKKLGINPGKLKKGELIITIQKAERNTPCFGTGTEACPYTTCCWREDCIA